jgi:signal peptidase
MQTIRAREINPWISFALACIVALIVLFATLVSVGTPVIVLSGSSMVPTFNPRDVVLLSKPHISEVNTGDIVAFRAADQTIVVHRVVGIGTDSIGQPVLTTKGDSNQWDDKELTDESNYVGKVVHVVPKAGSFVSTLQNPVLLALVSVTAMAFVLYQRRNIRVLAR